MRGTRWGPVRGTPVILVVTYQLFLLLLPMPQRTEGCSNNAPHLRLDTEHSNTFSRMKMRVLKNFQRTPTNTCKHTYLSPDDVIHQRSRHASIFILRVLMPQTINTVCDRKPDSNYVVHMCTYISYAVKLKTLK